MINIEIGNKEYKVKEAKTEEEKTKGLLNITNLPSNEGMLFYFDSDEKVSMWMKDTLIPLDIIFINDDQEVISIHKGIPNSEDSITESNVSYVLEVNTDSGIKPGDELIFKEENFPVMKVLALDGTVLMDLWGGERIFSRKNTRVLIRKAKKADKSNDDKDYRSLGRYMFKCIKELNERPPEYVKSPL